MFKIGIENYTVYGRHGAYEFEHENPQPFIVTIWVEITNHRFDDNLSQTVNYADLQNVAFAPFCQISLPLFVFRKDFLQSPFR